MKIKQHFFQGVRCVYTILEIHYTDASKKLVQSAGAVEKKSLWLFSLVEQF